ncbi:hypothetical protein FRZ67_18445 [Panacibacter ginsenosidivorans]|uniref:Uncharacterized protein n=1 Tax=Panacibacter ginsenosidivorans TaxID=1813871 RepID=A0A5B8VCL3_9BACT|nr:hypothetical protein [Panacibacter ginsenosidivorans]QEC69194.1 hypothetical protein FRZ67_18445 [Panacibacter ginsenosidivorans]
MNYTTGGPIKNNLYKSNKTKTVQPIKSFWSLDKPELFYQTDSSLNGLAESEASTRLLNNAVLIKYRNHERNGKKKRHRKEIPIDELVPGAIVLLNACGIIPADACIYCDSFIF